MASSLEKRKSPDHNMKERERRCFIQSKFQDLRVVLDLKATASKINVLKEAQLECSALQIMSDNLVPQYETVNMILFNQQKTGSMEKNLLKFLKKHQMAGHIQLRITMQEIWQLSWILKLLLHISAQICCISWQRASYYYCITTFCSSY